MKYLSIGQVAKLKNTSIKSLRYYDEIGILKPVYTNPKTGYRYYEKNQLLLLDAISLYLAIGLPLKDIDTFIVSGKFNAGDFLRKTTVMAQKKILAIQESISQFQTSYAEEDLTLSVTNLKLSSIFTQCQSVKKRTLLLLPIQNDISSTEYNRYIIQLFMLAQSQNLNAFYPSGKLYHYKDKTLQKYIFIQVEDSGIDIHNKNLLTLESGTFFNKKIEYSQFEEYWGGIKNELYLINELFFIETDVLDSSQDHFKYELQLKFQ